jgi:hypothetical protein
MAETLLIPRSELDADAQRRYLSTLNIACGAGYYDAISAVRHDLPSELLDEGLGEFYEVVLFGAVARRASVAHRLEEVNVLRRHTTEGGVAVSGLVVVSGNSRANAAVHNGTRLIDHIHSAAVLDANAVLAAGARGDWRFSLLANNVED